MAMNTLLSLILRFPEAFEETQIPCALRHVLRLAQDDAAGCSVYRLDELPYEPVCQVSRPNLN